MVEDASKALRAITIVPMGGRDHQGKQSPHRIDEDRPRAAFDLRGAIAPEAQHAVGVYALRGLVSHRGK